MIDEVKEYFAPKRFSVVAYICLIVHFLCGLIFIGVASELRKSELARFGCAVDKQSTASYKTYVEKTCYARYEQTYNSPLPLYGFVLLSIGLTVFASLIYSLGVRTRVEKVDETSNDRTSNTSDESKTDGEETSHGFYVFYFYFIHLVVRSLFGILFTVLQHTVFYPRGFDFEFSCNLPTSDVIFQTGKNTSIGKLNITSIACENSTASEKQLWSAIVSVLNTAFALITLGEVIYLIWRRFPVINCRSENNWSCDSEFITVYFLRKRYVRDEFQLKSMDNNAPLLSCTADNSTADNCTPDNIIADSSVQNCIDFYKQQVLKPPRSPDICYAPSTDLEDLHIDVVIHTARAQHKFSKVMERHEIFDVYMKVPEDSIRLEEIKDLFQPNKDTEGKFPRTILAVGRPGIGKTVLTDKITRDWANGIDEFYCGKIVFFFKFRWFNFDELNNLSLKTFLRYGTGLNEEIFESIFEEVLKEPQKAIFIFDGLDEFNGDLKNCLGQLRMLPNNPNTCMFAITLFIKLTCGYMLQGATVLVTSRPTADHFYSKLNFNRSVEIIGFTSDKIEEYVSRFCDNIDRSDRSRKIWNHITSSSDLLNLCYIPVNCFIVCVTLSGCLSDLKNDTGTLPTTLTELYKTAIDYFAEHHNRNLDETSSEQMLEKLQKLAFEGIENGQLSFNKGRFDEQMKRSGLVNSLSNPLFPVQRQYCFIHLTIQEFLAARHVAETLTPDEIEEFISTHGKNKKWDLVLQFIAGFLGEKMKMSGCDYHDCILAFVKSFTLDRGEMLDLRLSAYNLNVMRCLREVDDENIVKNACEKADLNVTNISHSGWRVTDALSTSDLAAATFVGKHLNNLKYLYLQNVIGEDNCFLEIGKLLQHRCLEKLVLMVKSTGSDLAKEQLTSALMKSKCTLNHEHAKLSHLHLSIGMNDNCVTNICTFIKSGHVSHLRILRLSDIGDEGVGMLCRALIQGNCTLNTLILDKCSLTGEGMRYLCEFLCDEHCELRHLTLEGNEIGDECVHVLCTYGLRKEQCKLTKLALTLCNLTDECAPLLSETLQDGNCKLTQLILDDFSVDCVNDVILEIPKTETCKARGLKIVLTDMINNLYTNVKFE